MAVAVDDVLCLSRALWVRRFDVAGRDAAATRNVSGVAPGSMFVAGAGAGARGLAPFSGRYIKDVQFSSSGRLDGMLLSWIMRHVVAVHHVVVPIALALLQYG